MLCRYDWSSLEVKGNPEAMLTARLEREAVASKFVEAEADKLRAVRDRLAEMLYIEGQLSPST